MSADVVITGAGILSPLGHSLETYCDNLMAGRVAIEARHYQAPGGITHRMVAPLDEIPVVGDIRPVESRFYSQLSLAAALCASRAIDSAGLDMRTVNDARAGVIFGSGFINLYDLAPVYEKFFTGDERHLSPLVIPINMANCPAGRISLLHGLRGESRTVSTACASSSTALASAWRAIRDGSHDVMIAGGGDLVCCTTLVRSWERLRILSPPTDTPTLACRPFDRARNGLALGDGAFLFVLESRSHAEQRGAAPLAVLRGAFENSDGFDMLKPSADGEVRCMQGALAAAGLDPGDVGLVHAHGTATALNDATEYSAMRRVFGDRTPEIAVCAIKSMIGHTMGASGGASLAAAIGSLRHGYVYPVPGFARADDGVEIRISSRGVVSEGIDHVLINAFGFGGANACLVVSAGATP